MIERFHDIAAWFEALTPQTLNSAGLIYADSAHFADPFNDVHGLPAIVRIYAHMFQNLDQPRFHIARQVVQGADAFLVWRFTGTLRGRPFAIDGASALTLDAQGLIADHQDYWDPASQVYERIPLLGAVLRRLRRKLATPDS
ncbi:nuclear transport factor 2 family protein [Achromobacter seleniivolatilans]|uniref:Nuclear transport factor 2 family protein n=1 Tax=Achromobacter seleniivolatilans TaxID=3047478 RepID=A0ABY9M109_9BURK|nr:nuclear transport factor 2 family protein [Achromobacter sp. R39]WMD20313.1 nuclear transport factor 2 family protein [Achromobacter sp. R39]